MIVMPAPSDYQDAAADPRPRTSPKDRMLERRYCPASVASYGVPTARSRDGEGDAAQHGPGRLEIRLAEAVANRGGYEVSRTSTRKRETATLASAT